MNLDVDTVTPPSKCSECGYETDRVGGPSSPEPGDFALCIRCASLNVIDTNGALRAPTRDEMLSAAADSDIQRLRRIILSVPKEKREG